MIRSLDVCSLSDFLEPDRPPLGEADLGLCGEMRASSVSSLGRLWLLPGLSLMGELEVEAAIGVKTWPLASGNRISLSPGVLFCIAMVR